MKIKDLRQLQMLIRMASIKSDKVKLTPKKDYIKITSDKLGIYP